MTQNAGRIDDPMALTIPTVHEAVRKSELVNALWEKIGNLPPNAFPYASELGRLRDVVAPQIAEMAVLFPEFTPHDEPLHVAKLYQLADRMFGSRVYREMHAAELFLLAAGLYAHDWGMAVGREEAAFLKSGGTKTVESANMALLPDEPVRLEAFMRREGMQRGQDGRYPELTNQQLRTYVRETHARRSGSRVRAHFHEHQAVGEALAQICEGHALDFATLEDPDRFHREYQVDGQRSCLLAVAVQVRLVDLFHITDDRTPFALWRFVSPKETRSAEEWKKHRALHGVDIIDFPPGRAIRVQGFTEDEEVWAGLRDLSRYCASQVEQSLTLSARCIPVRYGLDFVRVEWHVKTGELRPVDFRFEFDRAAMFRILSEDIYDGDHYVFLRELLQNSIDAIRTRLSHHRRIAEGGKKKSVRPMFDTTIYIDAEHLADGSVMVSCRDYGIGMDEHVLRNYFAVAGVSYYRSDEFERRHLGFEPISRYGIGILSCFMVADALEVKTYRDPECGPPIPQADHGLPEADEHRARRLLLSIPGVERQFVVRDLQTDFQVGTEVKLKVDPRKLNQSTLEAESRQDGLTHNADSGRKIRVAEYLCKLAGFVEFPILIDEKWPGLLAPRRTLVLHPDRDAKQEREQYEGNITIHQLERTYPWESVAEPESLDNALKLMTEHVCDVSTILGQEGYEGWIVYPVPRNKDWDISCDDEFGFSDRMESTLVDRATGNPVAPPFGWMHRGHYGANDPSTRLDLLSVYRDGILLENVECPDIYTSGFPLPAIHINLSSSQTSRPNVARTTLREHADDWYGPIFRTANRVLLEQMVPEALKLSGEHRLHRFGWLATVFQIPTWQIAQAIPEAERISVWLCPGNRIEVRRGDYPSGQDVPLCPSFVLPLAAAIINRDWLGHQASTSDPKCMWQGEPALVPSWHARSSSHARVGSLPIRAGLAISATWACSRLVPQRLRFLHPGEATSDALPQVILLTSNRCADIFRVRESKGHRSYDKWYKEFRTQPDFREAIVTALQDQTKLTQEQLCLIRVAITGAYFEQWQNPVPLPFDEPFAKCAGVRTDFANLNHGFGQAIVRAFALWFQAEHEDRVPTHLISRFRGLVQEHPYRRLGMVEFAERLFAVVSALPGNNTAPMSLCDACEWVPFSGAKALSNMSGFDVKAIAGGFGATISPPPPLKTTG